MDRSSESEDIEKLLTSLELRLASARVLGEEKGIIEELEQIVAEIRAALAAGDRGPSTHSS